MAEIVETLFCNKKYTVIVAENGMEALEKINANPDSILLDENMPGLAARILAHLKREERVSQMTEKRFCGELVIDDACKTVKIHGQTLEPIKSEYEMVDFCL